jgi:hypothetical protein
LKKTGLSDILNGTSAILRKFLKDCFAAASHVCCARGLTVENLHINPAHGRYTAVTARFLFAGLL